MVYAKDIRYNLINLKQLVFEVTDACNLRCKYCGYAEFYGGYDNRVNKNLSFDKSKQILDYLLKLWKENRTAEITSLVSIGFYGGEPLLNMNLVKEIVDYVKAQDKIGKKFIFNMTTNALLLDRYADYLAKNEFRLLISLDGDREGQSYRVDQNGHNSFDRVFNNIEYLRSNYPDYFSRFVMFNSVLHNRNSVESIFHFIKTNFNKEANIAQLNTSGIRPEKKEEFLNTYRGYYDSIMSSQDCESLQDELFIKNPITGAILDYIFYKSGNVFQSYNHLFLYPNKEQSKYLTGTCTPFSKKMFITVNGKILQCEKIDHRFYAGVVHDSGVDLDLELIASQHNRLTEIYKYQCEKCGYKNDCKKCIYQDDDILSETPICKSCVSKEYVDKEDSCALKYLRFHPELYYRLLKNTVVR